MDHELKQRLIGAVVVTALCAIFIPMLFDDPVDNSGQMVSELNIPAPAETGANTADKLPASAEQVLKMPDPEPLSTEPAADTIESTGAAEEVSEEPEKQGRSGESLYAESEGYTREDAGEEAVEQPVEEQPKPRPKQAAADKPLAEAAEEGVRKSIAPKTQVKDTHVETVTKESVKDKKIVEAVKPAAVKKPEL
ncbi:MAG: hypothetical protein WAW41_08415, partial [Methylobacter sp.]